MIEESDQARWFWAAVAFPDDIGPIDESKLKNAVIGVAFDRELWIVKVEVEEDRQYQYYEWYDAINFSHKFIDTVMD